MQQQESRQYQQPMAMEQRQGGQAEHEGEVESKQVEQSPAARPGQQGHNFNASVVHEAAEVGMQGVCQRGDQEALQQGHPYLSNKRQRLAEIEGPVPWVGQDDLQGLNHINKVSGEALEEQQLLQGSPTDRDDCGWQRLL